MNTQVVPILCWIHVEPEALLLVLLSQHQRHSQQTDFTHDVTEVGFYRLKEMTIFDRHCFPETVSRNPMGIPNRETC